MEFINKNKIYVIFIVSILIMILSVPFWNYISTKQSKDKDKVVAPEIDVSDANNINSVESKLGNDIKITQGYLLTYTVNKTGTWYMSNGYVKDIKTQGDDITIIVSESKDSKDSIKLIISKDKCDVKKGDLVYFVGTINLNSSSLELAKISKEEVKYNSVTKIKLNDLINNIKAIKDNYFIVSGYMVTDNEHYKLYDSKNAYKKNKEFGNYFSIDWKDSFNFTGNQNIKAKCKLRDTYKLNQCELIK